jgi:hypothetical protein
MTILAKKRPQSYDFCKALHEFLNCFNGATMDRLGVDFIDFNYDRGGIKYKERFTPKKIEKELEKCNLSKA